MSYALYGIMSYCAFMDIRRYRIPNRALAAAAAAGLAVSVEAWVSGAGNVGLWAAGIGFWMQDTGFWAAAAEGAAVFIMRLMLAAAAGFPFSCCGWWGPGILNLWPLWQAVLAWREDFGPL